MNNLLTFKYWFNFNPGNFLPVVERTLQIIIVILIILTLIFALMKSRLRKNIYVRLWQGLYYFSLTNAIIGSVLLFFNYETLPFLSARFWLLFWSVSMIIWLVYIYKLIISLAKKKIMLEKEKQLKKYIP